MKNLLLIALSVVLLAGCSDSFVGPERPVSVPSANNVIYTAMMYLNGNDEMPMGLWSIDLSTGVSRSLVDKPVYLLCAPQAGRIVYIEFNDALQPVAMKTARIGQGGEQTIIEYLDGNNFPTSAVAIAPDGNKIGYVVETLAPLQGYKIFLYDVARATSQQIDTDVWLGGGASPLWVSQLQFSSSGKWLSAIKWNYGSVLQTYVAATGEMRHSFPSPGLSCRWLSTGDTLVYGYNPSLIAVTDGDGQIQLGSTDLTSVVVGNVSTGAWQPIAESFGLLWDIAPQPNGQRFAVSEVGFSSAGRTDIVVFSRSLPNERDTLTEHGEDGTRIDLQWSAKGDELLYTHIYRPATLLVGKLMRLNVNDAAGTEHIVAQPVFNGYWYSN